jgi:hypothetical protein
MAQITVRRRTESTYRVTVEEGTSSTTHDVTVRPEDVTRYADPGTAPERLLEASFEFLLERESKESILRSFELPLIEQFFPEYPRRIREKL